MFTSIACIVMIHFTVFDLVFLSKTTLLSFRKPSRFFIFAAFGAPVFVVKDFGNLFHHL